MRVKIPYDTGPTYSDMPFLYTLICHSGAWVAQWVR